MISDSAGHVAKNWSGLPTGRKSQCIPAQRAFLSSSSIFFPFSPWLWMCYSQVRCTKNRRMTAITFPYSWRHDWLIGAAWVGIERGWCSFHMSLFRSPSVSSINPFGHIKNRHPLKSTSRKQKCKHNAHGNKRVQDRKKNQKQIKREKEETKKSSYFQYKTFSRPSFFSLILMTFFLKIFFSLSTLKSIKNLYRNTEKSQGKTL